MSVGDIPPGSHSGSVTTPGFEGIESGHRWQLFIVACSGVHEDTDSEKTREITFTESSPTKWRCTSMYCSPLVGAARRSQPPASHNSITSDSSRRSPSHERIYRHTDQPS